MSRTQTERQEIRDSHRDSWIAVNEGDQIMGKIADVTEAWSEQRRNPVTNKPGSYYPLLTIQAEEATGYDNLPRELKVHCFGAVLYNEIMRKQPNVGERIRIVYQGTGEAKSGQKPPELYVVRAASGTDVAKRAYATIQEQAGNTPVGAQQTLTDDDIPF